MNKDEMRGFVIGKLSSLYVIDYDTFQEQCIEALREVETEAQVTGVIDELREEGWIEYIEEGNNIKSSLPEGVKA
jgi:hydrogenase maturation factor HypE